MSPALLPSLSFVFFFNDTATTEIYTLSLHDALPIFDDAGAACAVRRHRHGRHGRTDRKSTRLNSSHTIISYAVFCLKKKNDKALDRAWTEHRKSFLVQSAGINLR